MTIYLYYGSKRPSNADYTIYRNDCHLKIVFTNKYIMFLIASICRLKYMQLCDMFRFIRVFDNGCITDIEYINLSAYR